MTTNWQVLEGKGVGDGQNGEKEWEVQVPSCGINKPWGWKVRDRGHSQ